MSEQEKQKAASLEDWATTLACLYANAGLIIIGRAATAA